MDQLLPDVLLFPPDTDVHDHPLVKNSSLVLQVSCPRFTDKQLYIRGP